MRNWYYFNWLCGDHIMEQHIHNIDVANWFIGSAPTKATGIGGRQTRIGPEFGEIFDHHVVEFEYAGGVIINSFSRHQKNTVSRVSEELIGTKGRIKAGMIRGHDGKGIWRHRGARVNPYQIEHDELFAAIRADKPLNNAYYGAESTLTSLMGRVATYTGQTVTRDEVLNAGMSLMPKTLTWEADPGPKAGNDGIYPCAIPGETKLA